MGSLIFENNKDLRELTTFHVPATAKLYVEYSSEKELLRISRTEEFLQNKVLHIGGGSNLLFTNYFNGLILHSKIKGIREYVKNEETVFAIVGAGEKWDDFVKWTIEHNYSGIENLVMIPGEVGASAVQNIGAYGVEVCDVIKSVQCFDVLSRKIVTFTNSDCRFGYRDSMFKNEGKGRYYVLRVGFRLRRDGKPSSLTYGPLKTLEQTLGRAPEIKDVANLIRTLREEKLPDPTQIGSAGSFFKNPLISQKLFEIYKKEYPDIPDFLSGDSIKLSAAWLIDKTGMKGYREGDAGVYEKQPLVLVNYGNATGKEILKVEKNVIKHVRTKFYINLQREVEIVDSQIKVTVLGSGTSKGIPEVGCNCYVCSSSDSRDKRLRSSVMVSTNGVNILIDASPDLREQLLRLDPIAIDGLLITHSHFDHVGGIDDLRPFCPESGLDIFLKKDVNDDLHRRLDYCFRDVLYPGVPHFKMHEIEDQPFEIKGINILPIKVNHGKLPILGYRIDDFAYITDAKTIDAGEMWKLENLEVLIVNALREKEHFAHFTLQEALDLINEVKPRRAYLTHFGHEIGTHKELLEKLPPNVYPCFDGEEIVIK